MASASGSEQASSAKVQRDRSPAYPFLSLKSAIERMIAFEAKFGRHPAPLGKAGLAWGMKENSSQAAQTLSTLKYFGLLEYMGPTADRVVGLTEDARNYLRAQQASVKAQILRACALRPKAMQVYWEKWGHDRPIDEVCLDELVLKASFTESASKVFLRVYDETIAFAGLAEEDKMHDGGTAADVVDNGGKLSPQSLDVPSIQSAPASQSQGVKQETTRAVSLPQKGPGMRQEVFVLAEGDVTIQWPEALSADSFQDFDDWLSILKRKIKRSVVSAATSKTQASPPEDDEM